MLSNDESKKGTTKFNVPFLSYIPLDYVKFQIIGLSNEYFEKRIELTPYLINGSEIDHHWYKFQNMTLKIFKSGYITLHGSLHKLYNNGLHNHNDFDESALDEVIKKLTKLLGIQPKNMRIICLEYGVNIKPTFQTNLILHNLLIFKRIEFKQPLKNGVIYKAELTDYCIKAYNKAQQYGLNFELLRFEIHQNNWKDYRKFGIETFEDFINYDKSIFVTKLLKCWNDIVLTNPYNKTEKIWNKYNNMHFWRDLMLKSRPTYCKHVNILKELNKNGTIDVQKLVHNLILEKINNLQRFTNSNFSIAI